jgi:outer membrane receptor protein involved in Fe transport
MAIDPNLRAVAAPTGSQPGGDQPQERPGKDVVRDSVLRALRRGVAPLTAIAAGSLIAMGASAQSSGQDDTKPSGKLEEIVVTAQKKVENLLEVPVPVTAISGQSLAASSQVRLENYYYSVPGLNLTKDIAGDAASSISIRGLSSGVSNPTVGVVVDDIPFASSSFWGGGHLIPEFDPSDLERVEVLRGPQGTLYGASTLGGLLKYVTMAPSTDAFGGHVAIGGLGIDGSGEYGWNANGTVNVPLGSNFAVRASAFTRTDPGYVDNVRTGQDDVNKVKSDGGRLSALWKVSDALSLQFGAMTQETESDGTGYQTTGLGDLEQSELAKTGPYDVKLDAYSLTAKLDVGSAEITSLTGYNIHHNEGSVDAGFDFSYMNDIKNEKFSQELRLAMPLTEKISWLVGAFYTHENSKYHEKFFLMDGTTGEVILPYVEVHSDATFDESALFTDFTLQLTDQFDVQLGARYAKYDQEFKQTWIGVGAPGGVSPFLPPPVKPSDSAVTYLVTPRYRISPDLMVYARFASGYRPGGPNSNGTSEPLPIFKPDETKNYELGVKGQVLDGALQFDASVYYIDWSDIQLQAFDPATGFSIYINANTARSEGVELSLTARPWEGFTVTTSAAWNDAQLTEDMPPNFLAQGKAGDPLPYSQKFSGYVSVEQTFPLNTLSLFVGGAFAHIDDRLGHFVNGIAASRTQLPSYDEVNLSAGVRGDKWQLSAYVNNVGDERGVLAFSDLKPDDYQTTRPRTYGITLSHDF